MSSNLIYRILVPDAPLYRRTEGDEYRNELFSLRLKSNSFLLDKIPAPGLQAPTLVSSFSGSIDRILFCLPSWASDDPDLVPAYQSVISSLRVGTKFIVVHHG